MENYVQNYSSNNTLESELIFKEKFKDYNSNKTDLSN